MPDTYEAIDERLLGVVLACRPAVAPLTAQVRVPGGTVVWGERSGVGTMAGTAEALWPFLDGTVSLAELAEDLAEAIDTELVAAQQHVAAFGLDLLAAHLADGLEPAGAVVAERVEVLGSGAEIIEYEQVIDGIHYRVSERTLTYGQLKEMTGGKASKAELVTPHSCVGKRLHLDRPALLRTLEVAGERYTVRVVDPELAAWLADLPEACEGKGPVIALVTDAEAGGDRGRRFGVYDGSASLVASTTDRDVVRAAIAGLVASEAKQASPIGLELRVRVLVKGDRAVVASLGALDRPRGMLRHLERAGITVLPTSQAWISADGERLTVPEPPLGRPAHEVDHERSFALSGIYAAANHEVVEVSDANLVHLLVRDMGPPGYEARQATLQAAALAVDRLPATVAFKRSASALTVARQVSSMFEA